MKPRAPRRRTRSVPAPTVLPAVSAAPSNPAPAGRLPNKIIFSIVFLVVFVLYLKSGLPAYGSPGWFKLLTAAALIYSLWTILWYICMRWPLVGIFIIGTIRSFFGGRGYRRW
jgi:hypothetical protein